jgi:hypothetical protein
MLSRSLRTLGLFAFVAAALQPGIALASRPTVQFRFLHESVEMGEPAAFTYRAQHVPGGSRLVFQRQVGTAQVWRTILTLNLHATTANLPPVSQGQHTLRLALIGRGERSIASAVHRLKVYGPVPLATLLDKHTETVDIGGTLFRYVAGLNGFFRGYNGSENCGVASPTCEVFKLVGSTCRSLALQLAAQTNANDATPPSVTIASERDDPVNIQVPLNASTEVHAELAGDAELTYERQGAAGALYVNGVANCYTPSGQSR